MDAKHVELVVVETRLMIVRIRSGHLDVVACVVHTPLATSSDITPAAFWIHAIRLVNLHVGDRPCMVFVDATTSAHMQAPGKIGSVTCGEHMHDGVVDFLVATHIWLPCIFSKYGRGRGDTPR